MCQWPCVRTELQFFEWNFEDLMFQIEEQIDKVGFLNHYSLGGIIELVGDWSKMNTCLPQTFSNSLP